MDHADGEGGSRPGGSPAESSPTACPAVADRLVAGCAAVCASADDSLTGDPSVGPEGLAPGRLAVTGPAGAPSAEDAQDVTELTELAVATRRRAEELYRSKRYLCTEAILVAMNETFGGGLTEETAAALAAAFPDGMGGSGCLCGAVSGGAMALGLLLAPTHSRREIRGLSAELHNRFRARHKSVCCRVLTKGVRSDKKAHFAQCAVLTGEAAAMAAGIVLTARPEGWPDLAGTVQTGPTGQSGQTWRRPLGHCRRLARRLARHLASHLAVHLARLLALHPFNRSKHHSGR